MEQQETFLVLNFYEFKDLGLVAPLDELRARLKQLFADTGVRGTIILASEGYNASICGTSNEIESFIPQAENILATTFSPKISQHNTRPLRKIDIKIKPEIVTLKRPVNISLGNGTHVKPEDWNEVISDPDVFILDTRNDYEFKNGTFKGSINPETAKFSDLPAFIEANLDPDKHKKIAMFCTGGIRCEKFAPYMKGLGFEQVFQLEGGILKYIETVPADKSMWEGECFVFDERRTLDNTLKQGTGPDYSQRGLNKKARK